MQTAYAIHNTDGHPIRRLVKTTASEDHPGYVDVAIHECDINWKPQEPPREFQTAPIKVPWYKALLGTKPEELYHEQLRNNMRHQYSWRFEIYWPFSDNV